MKYSDRMLSGKCIGVYDYDYSHTYATVFHVAPSNYSTLCDNLDVGCCYLIS